MGDHTTPHSTSPTAYKRSSISDPDVHADLRRKLITIQNSGLPEKDRAKQMQNLLMGGYIHATKTSSIYKTVESLSPSDLEKTYYDVNVLALGCKHYRRAIKKQCSTCNNWVTCRLCHDETEDHQLIRSATKKMMCQYCQHVQPPAQDCSSCSRRLARYYCDKCKLWDDDPRKPIYHCYDCGICRIGEGLGKDFFHCKKCGVCMAISLLGSHRCIERSTECDCPICGEFMFNSIKTVVFMACGHPVHQSCYHEHLKHSTFSRCPTCSKTIGNSEHAFRLLDNEIRRQIMPAPYNMWKTVISCNDCSGRSCVPHHFLGHKCETCGSYNTTQIKLIKPEDNLEAAPHVYRPGSLGEFLAREDDINDNHGVL